MQRIDANEIVIKQKKGLNYQTRLHFKASETLSRKSVI